MCACVCVCVCVRERDRFIRNNIHNGVSDSEESSAGAVTPGVPYTTFRVRVGTNKTKQHSARGIIMMMGRGGEAQQASRSTCGVVGLRISE